MLNALIVDDDIAVIQCFEKLIDWNALGYNRPYTAINGSDAYEIVVKHDISVVICDLKMPVMGGMEFVRLLRENNVKSQVILFSAYEDFTAACEGIELKVFDYLLKPLVLGTIERMSENLRKISVLHWLECMVDGEFDSDIVDRFQQGDISYIEELFHKINMLEETIGNEHIFQRIYVRFSHLITVFWRELGFS